ncbi:MAG: transcriptional regulator [Proteobacteria bacterium]|nr:transcriptional regulator [Pseudomonadota bacterium]HQR03954.1 type II toxin-antitoxin system RelE/ParE family toxin [Rhodocyclaceae bacterium]
MFTVIETSTFVRLASDFWNDEDRISFINFIAGYPEAGDVVPGSGGVRKTRWRSAGRGKSGGVRVIYFNRLANGEIWLLLVYGKSVRENIPAHVLRQIKEEIENA